MAENSWSAVSDSNRFVYLIAIVAALNGLLFGYDIGVISGALLYLDQTFTLSTFLKEVIVSSTLLAAAAGALIGGKFADYYGRRLMTFIGAVAFFIGSLVMALAPTVSWVIIGRIVAGLAIGIASIVGPMVIAEVSPPEIRGALGTLQQLAITVGILVGYFINYLFAAIIEGPAAWRWMLGFGMVLAAVLVIGMLKVPETPRWLVKHGREDDAREVLNRIRVDTDVEEELQDVKNIEKTEKGGFSAVFQQWARPALIVGLGLAIFQQVSGINTVLYYAPTIFSSIGLGSLASILATVGIGVVNVGMTFVAIRYADRVGRRFLLLVGVSGMIVSLALLGLIFQVASLSGTIGWIAAIVMIAYVAFYAFSLGPMFWLLISEIFPLEVRAAGEGVASFANWVSNFVVALTFLTLINVFGRAITFWIFDVICILGLLFIYFWVPETNGRSLEEIGADLRETALGGERTDMTEGEEIEGGDR